MRYAAFLRAHQPAAELPKVRGRRRVRHSSRGKTESTRLPVNSFDLYAATATLWKVEVTASNV